MGEDKKRGLRGEAERDACKRKSVVSRKPGESELQEGARE